MSRYVSQSLFQPTGAQTTCKRCLAAPLAQDLDADEYEVIVVDDEPPSDGTRSRRAGLRRTLADGCHVRSESAGVPGQPDSASGQRSPAARCCSGWSPRVQTGAVAQGGRPRLDAVGTESDA